MRKVFRRCFLVNFAVDLETMRREIPAPIKPDVHNGEAYVSVVIAEMEKMRSAILPRAFGVTYTQVVFGRDTHGRTSRVRIDRGAWEVAVVDDCRAEYTFMKSPQPFANAEARLDSVFYV